MCLVFVPVAYAHTVIEQGVPIGVYECLNAEPVGYLVGIVCPRDEDQIGDFLGECQSHGVVLVRGDFHVGVV